MYCRTPGLPVHHQLLEFTQNHVHWVSDAIQPSHSVILPSIFPSSCLLLLPSIFPSIRVFSKESVLHIRWLKYWSFIFSISPFNEYSGWIFFADELVWSSCSPRDSIFFFFHFQMFLFFNFYFFISWRLIILQYCSGFCHTLTWISRGFICVPHTDPPSHLPLHPIPLGLPSAPGPSTCLMHPAWAGDLFHPR